MEDVCSSMGQSKYSILTVLGKLMFLGTNANFEPRFYCNSFLFFIAIDIV